MRPIAAVATDDPAPTKANVLVVDDEVKIVETVGRILRTAGYSVSTASDATSARARLGQGGVDLVVTDMNMPGGSGLDLIEHVRTSGLDIATVMLTGTNDPELAERALEFGSYGFIIKPFQRSELLIAASNALRRRRLETENRAYRDELEDRVRTRTSELSAALQTVERSEQALLVSREDTIQRLGIAAEFRDEETASHIKRMSHYCGLLAEWSGLGPERAEMIRLASLMHDVGKIGIPDSVLLKPGKLTPDEYSLMQQHSEFGHRILTGSGSELLELAATIALTHHERWDGSGYPNGVTTDEIPLEGRIAAVADVFDALITHRVYRPAFALPKAIEIMKEGRWTQFDGRLLDLFLYHLEDDTQTPGGEDVVSSVIRIESTHDVRIVGAE